MRVYFKLANQTPALPGKLTKQIKGTHLDIFHNTTCSLLTRLGFGVWGTLGSRGRVGGVMIVFRTWGALCKIWWRLVLRFACERGT